MIALIIGILFAVSLFAYINVKLFCLFFIFISSIAAFLMLMCLLFDRRYPLGKEAVDKAPKRNGKIYQSDLGDLAEIAKYFIGPTVGVLISFIFGYFKV